jgi:hypothetical protein
MYIERREGKKKDAKAVESWSHNSFNFSFNSSAVKIEQTHTHQKLVRGQFDSKRLLNNFFFEFLNSIIIICFVHCTCSTTNEWVWKPLLFAKNKKKKHKNYYNYWNLTRDQHKISDLLHSTFKFHWFCFICLVSRY